VREEGEDERGDAQYRICHWSWHKKLRGDAMVERQNAGENGLMTAKRRQRGMSQPGGKMPKDAKKCTVVAKKACLSARI